MKSDFPAAVPEIPVTDINRAAAYYERNLGFSIDWGGEDDGIAGISRGHCRMFLTNGAFRKQHANTGPVLIWLNLDSKEDVNGLYDLWCKSQAKIVSAPESKPWGLHEFTVADMDGNLFRVFHDFVGSARWQENPCAPKECLTWHPGARRYELSANWCSRPLVVEC